jgi:RNA recognition motif-containing protein
MVRGIPRGVAITEVAELFARFGADAERIALPRDRRTRRRKGYAYVIVPSQAHADAAIAALNGLAIGESKPLEIELAVERPPKVRRGPPRR